jgi:GT2 family glycosyltransferase
VTLSIIIVNYNVKYFIEQAIRTSLKASEHIDAEIIVVDNASIDGSQSMIKNFFPEVQLIDLKNNLGFSKANNHWHCCSKRGIYSLIKSRYRRR